MCRLGLFRCAVLLSVCNSEIESIMSSLRLFKAAFSVDCQSLKPAWSVPDLDFDWRPDWQAVQQSHYYLFLSQHHLQAHSFFLRPFSFLVQPLAW